MPIVLHRNRSQKVCPKFSLAAVCKRDDIQNVIKRLWETYPDSLSETQVTAIYEKLSPLTNQDEAVKAQHVQAIKEKYVDNTVCPLCGGDLVLRRAKSGPRAGKQFYGCSNYPTCKYVKNID